MVLLNEKKIKFTSVDFVRFTWLNPDPSWENPDNDDDDDDDDDKDDDDDGDDDDDDDDDDNDNDNDNEDEDEDLSHDIIRRTRLREHGVRHYTNPTIWIGVLPGTLTGAIAHSSSQDIRAFLDSLDVQNIDIAYRELVYKPLAGHSPALFPPSEFLYSLVTLTDRFVSAMPSIPISGRETTMEGTLGPFFRVGDKLYAMTVRHNLFPLNGDNDKYCHHGVF